MTLTATPTYTTVPAAAPLISRKANVALWSAQIVIALFFAFASALPKLIAHASAVEGFDKIGYGDWFMYFVGLLELAGAIALVVPRLAGLSALAMVGLMAGAEVFIWVYADGEYFYSPVIFGAIIAAVAWGRRASTAALYAQLRGRA